jgi:hypothetical protein
MSETAAQSYYSLQDCHRPIAAHDVELFRQRRDILIMHPEVVAVRAKMEDLAGR